MAFSAILLFALAFVCDFDRKEKKTKVEEDPSSRIRRDTWITLPLFPWEIKKILTIKDVGIQGALELTAHVVYNRILLHLDKKTVACVVYNGRSVAINIKDEDTGSNHRLMLRKQPWCDDFTIDKRWKEEFVVRRGLKAGMLIGMYWDIGSRSLRFSILD